MGCLFIPYVRKGDVVKTEEAAALEAKFVTLPQIAADFNVDIGVVNNWRNYYRYFEIVKIFDKPVVPVAEYERFKKEHPELRKEANAIAA
jgi:hypothetical protein